MSDSRELSRIYMRIFLVEAAYWIISIGMVFINESVLKDKILTDDLTVFVTIFQILTSLIILITLNHITKRYLAPELHQPHHTPTSKLRNDDNDYKPLISNKSDEDEDEEVLFLAYSDKRQNEQESVKTDNQKQNYEVNREATPITDKFVEPEKKFSSAKSEVSDRSSIDGGDLKQLFIITIPRRLSLETCKIVFPLSILYIGMLLLNNFCLKYVGVAFYFVSRSLTTVFNVIFTYFLMNESVSAGALACCGFIVLGFILGVDQENVIGSLSVMGVSFGVASSLFTSLFSIYTKKVLVKLDRNIWVLVLYNNINAIVLCTPLLIVHGDIQALISERLVDPSFWFLLSISGVMAFFISIVTNASIKYTSPLTHNISGTAKACFQTVIAVIHDHDHKSPLWWLSNMTILVASAMYSRIKQLEMERKTSASAVSQKISGTCDANRLARDDSYDLKEKNAKSINGLQKEEIILESSGRDSSSSGFSEIGSKLLNNADNQTGSADTDFFSVKLQSPN